MALPHHDTGCEVDKGCFFAEEPAASKQTKHRLSSQIAKGAKSVGKIHTRPHALFPDDFNFILEAL